MSIKSLLAKPFAYFTYLTIKKWAGQPLKTQEKVFKDLIQQAANTQFGKDHKFSEITTYEHFVARVPIRDYEDLKPYVERVVAGESNILWPEKPLYFAKTSGTTSGAKYIPITKESMPNHIKAARNAILMYIHETGNSSFVEGKMIFLQGSPVLKTENGVQLGRLSGIVAHYVPKYLQKNRMPSWETNCIDDWEAKVSAIVDETFSEDLTVISGIPSWVQMYFEKLQKKTGKPVGDVFKNFNLFIYGGVNYEPYRAKFEDLIGRKVDSIELYPASEGFFAFQDCQTEKGMLLQLDSGMFYEFVEADSFFHEQPKRITIKDVKVNVNYVMLISSNAGLWCYNIGDTVQFTSIKPYRIIVSGRIKHFISGFGEHVIGKEVECALQEAMASENVSVSEFTVAPQINPESGLPYHEWFIEFEKAPENVSVLSLKIDRALQEQNSYYRDLIEGKVLQPLKITTVQNNGFQQYMKSIGKLGGQNKLPRLSNDRKIADALQKLSVEK
ncbi:GH3 auxin-responsive promoter family protein [Bizionia gelidisalsuginis]|uniref:GH3 auxin-responsive promoter family protein n=2 Tax=Bizionia TaxID=283785 RepID=A0A8H2LCJ5_9FLAO|nr:MULTISPECIES: GH3 auxin-responsive promoter family protein [Bizionia]TYB74181.1 GH3 auxin-responsive promoter family protein [Bizionia saleffrena]TYC15636.1 GH3 auxin-responsive promoter family protein [Bizionia gelidisalsuginis]